jgi:predicted nucleic acid-binding protein
VVVISDTSPINYLCQIGHIEILPAIFGRVVVPSAVAMELEHSAAPESVHHFITNPPAWLEICDPSREFPSIGDLGDGEQQALALAAELRADLLIVDDLEARSAAEARSITVIGTLGVLKLASGRKLVDLTGAFADLQACGFYISENLKREMLGDGP